MPKRTQEYEQEMRSYIRRLTVMNPQISNYEIERVMRANGFKIERRYIGKLRKKNDRKRAMDAERYTMKVWLEKFIENMNESDRLLWQIATDKSAKNGERVYALTELRKNNKTVFDTLAEAGVFEKQLGHLNINSIVDLIRGTEIIDAEYKETTGEPDSPVAIESGEVHQGHLGRGDNDMGWIAENIGLGGEEQKDSSEKRPRDREELG